MRGRAAELRVEPTRKHVERLEHDAVVEMRHRRLVLRPSGLCHHTAQWVDVDDARALACRPDRLDARNGGTAQRDLQRFAAPDEVRSEQARMPACEGQEARLVNWGKIAGALTPHIDVAGGGMAVIRETLSKAIAQRVEVTRIAIVEQIPDHLHAVPARRLEKGVDAGEVISAATQIDERPADRFARRPQANRGDVGIVGVGPGLMSRRHHLVEPLAIAVEAGRSLEAGKKETREHQITPHAIPVIALRNRPASADPDDTILR